MAMMMVLIIEMIMVFIMAMMMVPNMGTMMISQVQAVPAEPRGMPGTGTKIFPKVGSDSYVAE